MTSTPSESNRARRWREIGQAMADDAPWRRGVQVLALIVHDAFTQGEVQEMHAFADGAIDHLFRCASDEAATGGYTVSEAQADDIAHAFLAAAVGLAEAFPFFETGLPS